MRDEPGRSTFTAGDEAGRVSGRIAEEHRHLRELLGRVRATRELQPLLTLLGELRADLVAHFATEEASGGIRDVIDGEAPHLLERVDHLFDEHRLCLEEIDRISERIRRVLDGPVSELLRDADRLVETLHRHEAAETELLSGALYDEIGGGDRDTLAREDDREDDPEPDRSSEPLNRKVSIDVGDVMTETTDNRKTSTATVAERPPDRRVLEQCIVEIVSDSGEGAQKAGQTFGTVGAKMGNGVWTVEIIPAEIKPPARSRAGASGIRVRLGSHEVTNMGDEADLVVAFNEQVLYGRIAQGAYREGTTVLLESKWADDPQEEIRHQYAEALEEFRAEGLEVRELPFEEACKKVVDNPRLGKNMFILGVLCEIYGRDLDKALDEVETVFRRKGEKIVEMNQKLIRAGWDFARERLGDLAFEIPRWEQDQPVVVMNGNQAAGLGVMAAGMELVSMYPITPATSVSHYLARGFSRVGGVVHQAEDEIAAIGFAIGASYAGKTACTVTSGPGLALKTEFLGLAVMAEVPLVVIVVQRGGPSTGLPTKVEQGDLMAALHASPGDAPKVVMAPATIEECYHFVPMARKLAEDFRTPVMVLTDANLATGVAPFPRPRVTTETMAPPLDLSPWEEGLAPYDWDPETGLSPRPIPGQKGGEYCLTGLAHTQWSKVAYDPASNQTGCTMRSRKIAALAKTLVPPTVHGDDEGDLLVVGWGSTLGAIEEAVDRLRGEGHKVSSLHVRFLSPLEPGLPEIFERFRRVMTVEINYSDRPGDPMVDDDTRRHAQLAALLRQRTLMDVDSWSVVEGQPLAPRVIEEVLLRRLEGREDERIQPKAAGEKPPRGDREQEEGEMACSV